MLSGSYLKQPRGKDENVPGKLALVKENVRNADWESAQQDLEDHGKGMGKKSSPGSSSVWKGMKSTTWVLAWLGHGQQLQPKIKQEH